MKMRSLFITCSLMLAAISSKSQIVYHFPTIYNPAGCAFTYEINITIRLDSVKVTDIYFDDGVNGSFAFEAYFSYQNTFVNSTLPPGNFFTYDISVFTDNINITPQMLTNNAGNVPVQTGAAGGLASQNNPTFNGSASTRSLVAGGVYSSNTILLELGYDSATLHINLPCLDTLVETNDSGTLPVSWSTVTSSVSGREVTLSWQTFLEQNNREFRIEKSSNGTSWQTVRIIPSKAPGGNSDETLSYSYTQTQQWGERSFYRVVQQDLDGRLTYSNIVIVSLPDEQSPDRPLVFPNPSSNIIYLRHVPVNTIFTIRDSYGRVVQQGRYNNQIDISGLRPGIYSIHTTEIRSRFVVVR